MGKNKSGVIQGNKDLERLLELLLKTLDIKKPKTDSDFENLISKIK